MAFTWNNDKSRNASIGYSLCCATAFCICNFGFKLLHNVMAMNSAGLTDNDDMKKNANN